MYKEIKNMLEGIKDIDLLAIIDEGRSRKRKEKCRINGIYDRVFTIKVDDKILSFSYADLICKAIILKKV